jgi:hypothetical protein
LEAAARSASQHNVSKRSANGGDSDAPPEPPDSVEAVAAVGIAVMTREGGESGRRSKESRSSSRRSHSRREGWHSADGAPPAAAAAFGSAIGPAGASGEHAAIDMASFLSQADASLGASPQSHSRASSGKLRGNHTFGPVLPVSGFEELSRGSGGKEKELARMSGSTVSTMGGASMHKHTNSAASTGTGGGAGHHDRPSSVGSMDELLQMQGSGPHGGAAAAAAGAHRGLAAAHSARHARSISLGSAEGSAGARVHRSSGSGSAGLDTPFASLQADGGWGSGSSSTEAAAVPGGGGSSGQQWRTLGSLDHAELASSRRQQRQRQHAAAAAAAGVGAAHVLDDVAEGSTTSSPVKASQQQLPPRGASPRADSASGQPRELPGSCTAPKGEADRRGQAPGGAQGPASVAAAGATPASTPARSTRPASSMSVVMPPSASGSSCPDLAPSPSFSGANGWAAGAGAAGPLLATAEQRTSRALAFPSESPVEQQPWASLGGLPSNSSSRGASPGGSGGQRVHPYAWMDGGGGAGSGLRLDPAAPSPAGSSCWAAAASPAGSDGTSRDILSPVTRAYHRSMRKVRGAGPDMPGCWRGHVHVHASALPAPHACGHHHARRGLTPGLRVPCCRA